MTDPQATGAAQPAATDAPSVPAGQGAPEVDGLYPDLSSLPEDLREAVMPHLKAMEGNITRKLQEAADYRKTWEPYKEMGIPDLDPEELQELLQFRELAQDPDQFRAWHQEIGKQLTPQEEAQQAAENGQLTADSVKTMLEQALEQRLGPIQKSYEEQEQQRLYQEAESQVNSKLDALQEQHGEFDRDAVCQLALAYDGEGPDAVAKGFADYQRLIGSAEKGVFQSKLDQPATPETGGRPATQVQKITSFGEASTAAKEVLAAAARAGQ